MKPLSPQEVLGMAKKFRWLLYIDILVSCDDTRKIILYHLGQHSYIIYSNSSTKSYSLFLHHIVDNLNEQKLGKLKIGSGDEYDMKASNKRCFPNLHMYYAMHAASSKDVNDYIKNTWFPYEIVEACSGCNIWRK